MAAVVSVEHVSKIYRLGSISAGTLSADVSRWLARVRQGHAPVAEDTTSRRTGDIFRALTDVSFEVQRGQVVGIVGGNGAGKSTLLKILSQVTAPTKGRIKFVGRIASLLEVGTGFHPELTGRENVFLNGAILGMRKHEIAKKFDEIVDFSECESFIDTPVKRYSSGMYVRLAFAVAAHMDPEILIIDEVLAVGDARFQSKCLGKVDEASRGGRTVLFVSHNMAAVKRLCHQAVVLSGGRVVSVGSADDAIAYYLAEHGSSSSTWSRAAAAPANDAPYLEDIRVTDQAGHVVNMFPLNAPITVSIAAHARVQSVPLQIAVRVTNQEGVPVFSTAHTDGAGRLLELAPGRHQFSVQIPGAFLVPGQYTVRTAIHIPRKTLFDSVETVSFAIEDADRPVLDDRLGLVTPQLPWQQRSEGLSTPPA
jgi:lipopolysaccharide transport system ATP-binding protein